MKHPLQHGFTLVEMLVVAAIVGLLASFAIPVYQRYVAQAQIAEGVSLTHRVRAAVEEFAVEHHRFPTEPSDLLRYNVSFSSRYVSQITMASSATSSATGALIVTFKSNNVSSLIAGQSIYYFRSDDGVWNCRSEAAGSATMDSRLTPKTCI